MNPKSNWQSRKYHLPRGFTTAELLDQVKIFISNRYQYTILEDYYLGKHDILSRAFTDVTKPNNKVVNNFAKVIVDTTAAYFLGKPITYVASNLKTVDKIDKELSKNTARDVDSELAKLTSIYGHAFEFHWINTKGEHKFKYVKPSNTLAIYSADLDEELLTAVNISITKDIRTNEEIYWLEIYDENTITKGKYTRDGEFTVTDSKPHVFGEVPVIEYLANDERQGDFETVITMIDAYNQTVSDSVNDIEYFNDAYLVLTDLLATGVEDIQEMRNNRVLMVDGTGKAEFLTKTINDKHVENIKDRLVMDIHKFGMTPNLSDEQFATNLSGTAIKYKMTPLDNKVAIRERKFTTGLMKRLRLLFKTLGLRGTELENDMRPIFVRDVPANLVELSDMAIKLKDIVSDETLRGQFPFVLDLEKEAELVEAQIDKQFEREKEMEMFPPSPNNGMNKSNLAKQSSKADQ